MSQDRQESDYLLDIRGIIIPITLLKVTQAFREMKTGDTMGILVGDVDTRRDLFKVLPASLYELVEIKEEESFHRIFLRKGG